MRVSQICRYLLAVELLLCVLLFFSAYLLTSDYNNALRADFESKYWGNFDRDTIDLFNSKVVYIYGDGPPLYGSQWIIYFSLLIASTIYTITATIQLANGQNILEHACAIIVLLVAAFYLLSLRQDYSHFVPEVAHLAILTVVASGLLIKLRPLKGRTLAAPP